MLGKWLTQQMRHPSIYKFPVTNVTELVAPNECILDDLALTLLLAHGNPQLIKDQYNLLLKDAEDNSLQVLKKYLEDHILPDKSIMHGIARIGNFGEVLASTYMIEFENFWFPIYKLRFREKKDWAMRLTDLCLIKRVDNENPLVSYGEVKTISGNCDKNIAIKGHDSLVLGEASDFLAEPEILRFISRILYETDRLEEAQFISQIQLGIIKYNKRHDLFIIHSSEQWTEEILDRLEGHPLDQRLVDFSIKIVLLSQLRQLIGTVYDRCTTVTNALIKSMDKQDYLQKTYFSLESLMKDRQFRNDLAQVQARSIQEELLSVQPDIHYTFQAKEVWKRCDYIFSNSSLLLREESQIQENADKRKTILDSLKTAAQSFEFLSKFAEEEEREILLINAAICYHIAGYHANAQCLAKSVERKYLSEKGSEERLNSFDTRLTWFFRLALLSFLRRDIVKLQRITQRAISFILTLQETLISDTEEDQVVPDIENLYGHIFFQKSLLSFTEYCKNGTIEQLTLAQKNIEKCHTYFQRVSDTRLDTIASELRTLLKLFEGCSTWSNIEKYGEDLIKSPIWNTYLRNLALEKSIVEFWASQLKALQGELLTSDDSFVIQMPTSAGKTFIAELAILATLTNSSQNRCLYIAPYRALVNEIEDRLAETLGALGYRVSNLAGGFEFDSFQNFLAVESHVLVTTPEKADLLFRTHPEYFESITTIVIDEGHMLDEGIPTRNEIDQDKTLSEVLAQNGTLGRGFSLEILITRLKQKLPQAHFLFLSAVMSEVNVEDFVEWLSKNSQKPLKIERTERPSRQTIATFRWSKGSREQGGHNGQLQYFNSEGPSTYVSYFLKREVYYTGELTPSGRNMQTITWPNHKNK
ncbi:MAG TPA: DEAD/DEAH box helicase, partial [Methylomirabilota bacterium]|nr:DEAD/DEAH box helicase [Methylomirabilota bacterium]